jgi:membrane-associated phospholipid phosphatase
MGPEWVAIIALVALFAIGTLLPINMGALAYVAAWLVGMYSLDMTEKDIVAGVSGDLILTIIGVIAVKAYTGSGTPLRGGLPSGHAAIAFGGWMAITNVVGDSEHWFLISSLAFLMALLVAQTRVESGIHSLLEVTFGGVLGTLAVLVIFQVFA